MKAYLPVILALSILFPLGCEEKTAIPLPVKRTKEPSSNKVVLLPFPPLAIQVKKKVVYSSGPILDGEGWESLMKIRVHEEKYSFQVEEFKREIGNEVEIRSIYLYKGVAYPIPETEPDILSYATAQVRVYR